MEAILSDRWKPESGDAENNARAVSQRKTLAIFATTFLFVSTLVLAYAVMDPFTVNAQTKVLDKQVQVEDFTRIERDVTALTNRVSQLEQANATLGQEVGLLTNQNGVLSQIIQQIRSIKGEAESMRQEVFGAIMEPPSLREDMVGGDTLSEVSMAAPRARHLVVTPREKVSPETTEKTAKKGLATDDLAKFTDEHGGKGQ